MRTSGPSTVRVTPGFSNLHNPTACYRQQCRREWTTSADRRRKGLEEAAPRGAWNGGGGEGSFWAAQRRRCHQRRARSGGSAQAMEGPADRGRHRQQAAAARAHQRRQRPRAHPQQQQRRRRRRQLQLPPAASPLAARGGSQCEPPDPGRLGPRSAGGCRRFNLQQPTLGRSAKGAHGPVGWQLAAAPLGCAPERRRGLRAEARGDA